MPERKDHTLFVVFHGLIPLVEHKDGFHAILIEMSDHWVSVGHWLAEVPRPKCQGAPIRRIANRADGVWSAVTPLANLLEEMESAVGRRFRLAV